MSLCDQDVCVLSDNGFRFGENYFDQTRIAPLPFGDFDRPRGWSNRRQIKQSSFLLRDDLLRDDDDVAIGELQIDRRRGL